MRNSIEILKKCCSCGNIQLIENFNKDKNRKDAVCPQCINCRKDFYFKNLDKIKNHNERNKERRNNYRKNKRETDVKFHLIASTRNRIYKSLKGLTKQSSTKEILGIDIETYRNWVEWQMTPERNWTNIEVDHVKPICMVDISDNEQLKKAVNWRNTQT